MEARVGIDLKTLIYGVFKPQSVKNLVDFGTAMSAVPVSSSAKSKVKTMPIKRSSRK